MNACQEDQGNAVLAIEGIPDSSNKMAHYSYKVSEQMHSNAFKRRLAFSFTAFLLTLKLSKKCHY